MLQYFIIGLFAFVSFFFGMLGLGGGVFYTPLQILLGIDFNDAVTTSLLLIFVTSLSSSYVYMRQGLVILSFVFVAEIFTASGSFIAGYFAPGMDKDILLYCLVGILFINSYLMIRPPNYSPMKKEDSFFNYKFMLPDGNELSMNLLFVGPAFFFSGAIASLVGIGGGALKLPIMVVLLGFPVRYAIANSAAMIVITSLAGIAGRAVQMEINWEFGVMASFVVFIGSRAGAKMSLKTSPAKLKKILGAVLLIIAVVLMLKQLNLSL